MSIWKIFRCHKCNQESKTLFPVIYGMLCADCVEDNEYLVKKDS